jgi:hypothetical protein
MHFVLLWKTWFEGKINTTWSFLLVDHTNEWKPRGRSSPEIIPSVRVEEVMSSMDPMRIAEFEAGNVHGLILSALIESESVEQAIATISESFPDAEILRCVPVLDQWLPNVKSTYESPGSSPGRDR